MNVDPLSLSLFTDAIRRPSGVRVLESKARSRASTGGCGTAARDPELSHDFKLL
jgi:hypothetical protein